MKKILLLVFLMVSAITMHGQCAWENKAFKSGEYLAYNLYFNWKMVWVKVGTASMSTVQSNYKGQPAYRTSLITRGNSRADNFFVMRDTLLTYSTTDLSPLYYRKGAHEGKRYTVDEVFYTYPGGKCHIRQHRQHNDKTHTWKQETYQNCVFDMLNIFQRARSFNVSNWEKGHVVRFNIADGKGITPAFIKFQGKYYIKGDNGVKYRCLKLSYQELDDGKYKEIARFFVTDDDNHIPVRIDMNLRFGSAKAFVTQIRGNRSPLSSVKK